ncbi:cytochrome b/b6 domain-containing protein [Hydrogenophaga sp. PAMC20947]|uniref:cytochrome b/b6 domain-containing protein n=1 Tax=Hydrogenophaga sp. PAMC20947 TaxID=2565558 RepID=UPI001B350984|nr:cytochrome b/b6 domain-containing protein [Hydrogenophaga sp. PAMC20947]
METSRPVWDRFVRFFHWTVVSCVFLNYFVFEAGEWPHQWAGYLATGFVVARIGWGFIGSRHARFSDFFPTPSRLTQHLRAVRMGQPVHHWGHNPLGALMMLALMSVVLTLGFTGWLQGTDAFFGEEWLQDLHRYLANSLMTLVGLHATSALIMGRVERTRLVKAMVTGVKERY